MLARFGFTPPQQWTRVAELSGGERRRLQLLRILMAEPNVLILDEPTNDLDTDTLSALEDLLDSWPGTLIVVSHDRYLIERVTDDVYALMGDGAITHLPGGVDEYLRRRASPQRHFVAAGRPQSAVVAGAGARGSGGGSVAAEHRAARKEVARLERRLEALDRREKQLHAALAEAATDAERVLALDTELREVTAERDAVEEAWLAAAEAMESAEQR